MVKSLDSCLLHGLAGRLAHTTGVRGYHAMKLATHQKEQVTADAALFVFPVSELKRGFRRD
jgi:hypothetical protein